MRQTDRRVLLPPFRRAAAAGLVCLVGLAVPPSVGDESDPCAAEKLSNGWCEARDTGWVAAVAIPSKMLWETMDAHGHELDLDTFVCRGCREAIRTDGFCEEHHIGFVENLAYFSRLTYELARAGTEDPAPVACPVCRGHANGHGWCAEHAVGRTGPYVIRDRAAWDRVERSLERLELAVDTVKRCEYCAVAIVTDTRCPFCRIAYRDGREVPETTPEGDRPRAQD